MTLTKRTVTKRWMQILASRWVRAMLYYRETFCIFENMWSWLVRIRGSSPIPHTVARELMMAICLLPLMRGDLRLPVSGLVTASDASLDGGAVCRSVRLTAFGVKAAELAKKRSVTSSDEKVLLISLFDGIGGARRCFDLLNLGVAHYVAAESDPYASRCCRYAWPDVECIADVSLIASGFIQELQLRVRSIDAIFIVAGTPCQDLSSLTDDGSGLEGSKSSLFWDAVRIWKLFLQLWSTSQVFFFVENVAWMTEASRDEMSAAIGVHPSTMMPVTSQGVPVLGTIG